MDSSTHPKSLAGKILARLPRRSAAILIVMVVLFGLSMYQAAQPIRSVTAEVGDRKIQLALHENDGVLFGTAEEGDKKTRVAVAALVADKAGTLGLPLVEEKQVREAKLETDKATGACQFIISPGQTIAFDPTTFHWRSRSVQQ